MKELVAWLIVGRGGGEDKWQLFLLHHHHLLLRPCAHHSAAEGLAVATSVPLLFVVIVQALWDACEVLRIDLPHRPRKSRSADAALMPRLYGKLLRVRVPHTAALALEVNHQVLPWSAWVQDVPLQQPAGSSRREHIRIQVERWGLSQHW